MKTNTTSAQEPSLFEFDGRGTLEPSEDLFEEIMVQKMGTTVLHPGGHKSTRLLAQQLPIGEGSRVLDIGCCRGSGAIYLAKRYRCRVLGVDVSAEHIENARRAAKKAGVAHLCSFEVGDARDLRFAAGSFDAAIFLSTLTFIDPAEALREARRVVRPGGGAGAIELCWRQELSPEVRAEARRVLCKCDNNALTHEGWIAQFRGAGFVEVTSTLHGFRVTDPKQLVSDEGVIGALRHAVVFALDSELRARIIGADRFYTRHADQVGYGIYIGRC